MHLVSIPFAGDYNYNKSDRVKKKKEEVNTQQGERSWMDWCAIWR
jgi:hypothetical protein